MTMEWKGEEFLKKVRLGAMAGVTAGAHIVKARGTQLIAEPPKTGRTYRRRGVTHQASAPGEAPATDQGKLIGSSDVFLEPEDLTARINWAAEYAEFLELGTEKMEPRPFARRALTESTDQIEEAVRSAVEGATGL